MIPLEPHFKNKKECELWPLTVLLIDRRKSQEGFTRKEFQQSHSSLRQGTRSPEKLRVQHHMAKLVAGLGTQLEALESSPELLLVRYSEVTKVTRTTHW